MTRANFQSGERTSDMLSHWLIQNMYAAFVFCCCCCCLFVFVFHKLGYQEVLSRYLPLFLHSCMVTSLDWPGEKLNLRFGTSSAHCGTSVLEKNNAVKHRELGRKLAALTSSLQSPTAM